MIGSTLLTKEYRRLFAIDKEDSVDGPRMGGSPPAGVVYDEKPYSQYFMTLPFLDGEVSLFLHFDDPVAFVLNNKNKILNTNNGQIEIIHHSKSTRSSSRYKLDIPSRKIKIFEPCIDTLECCLINRDFYPKTVVMPDKDKTADGFFVYYPDFYKDVTLCGVLSKDEKLQPCHLSKMGGTPSAYSNNSALISLMEDPSMVHYLQYNAFNSMDWPMNWDVPFMDYKVHFFYDVSEKSWSFLWH